jgi:hypothetical protein
MRPKTLFMALLFTGAMIFLTASFCHEANAQTPAPYPDVPLDQVSGTYTVKAQMPEDADVIQLCVVRVDLVEVIEYGCVDAGPSEVASMEITVEVTPDVNAEIKAYAKDAGGLVSNYSPNSGWIDFTKPGTPVIML